MGWLQKLLHWKTLSQLINNKAVLRENVHKALIKNGAQEYTYPNGNRILSYTYKKPLLPNSTRIVNGKPLNYSEETLSATFGKTDPDRLLKPERDAKQYTACQKIAQTILKGP